MQVFKIKLAAALAAPFLVLPTIVKAKQCQVTCNTLIGDDCNAMNQFAYGFAMNDKGAPQSKPNMKHHYFGQRESAKASVDIWNNGWFDLSTINITPSDWSLKLTVKQSISGGTGAVYYQPASACNYRIHDEYTVTGVEMIYKDPA